MKKRSAITLVEILIVMLLIGIITGTLAYNYQGGLKKASEFKSNTEKQRIKSLLSIHLAEHPDEEGKIKGEWADLCVKTGLVDQATANKWLALYSANCDNGEITVVDLK